MRRTCILIGLYALAFVAVAGCGRHTTPRHVRSQPHVWKWGFIDKTGKIAIGAQFDGVTPFHEGAAAVRVGKKWGFIDKRGHFIIRPAFLGPSRFSDGVAFVTIRWTTHDTENDHSGDWNELTCIDKTGRHLFSLRAICFDFSDGLAAFGTGFNSTDGQPSQWGFVNKTGRVAIKQRFETAQPFSEGLAFVAPLGGSIPGYIDTSGRFVVRRGFDLGSGFHEGLAAVTLRGKTGYIDRSGRIVVWPRFDDGGDFHSGRAMVLYRGKYGYIDPNGVMRVNARLHGAADFSEGMAKFRDARTLKWGYIDTDGSVRIKARYDGAVGFHEGLALVQRGDKWGYIDRKGSMVVVRAPSGHQHTAYDETTEEEWSFSEGLAPVPVRR